MSDKAPSPQGVVVPIGRLKLTDRVVLGDVLRARKSFTNPDILTKGDVVIVQSLTDDGCVYFQNLFRCSPQAGLRLDWFDFVHRPPTRLKADYSHMSAAPAPSSLAGGEVWNPYQITPNDIAAILDENADCSDHGGGLLNASQLARKIWDAGLAALSPEAPARDGPMDKFDADLVEALDRQKWSGVASTLFRLTKSQADRLRAALTPRHEAPAEGAGEREEIAQLAWQFRGNDRLGGPWYEGAKPTDSPAMADVFGFADRILALRARSSAPEAREGEAVAFGRGLVVVNTGRFHGEPAVFIAKAVKGGEIGASADAEGFSRDSLQSGETVWTFPTEGRANAVADALVGVTHPAAPSADKLRIAVEALEPFGAEAKDWPPSIVALEDRVIILSPVDGKKLLLRVKWSDFGKASQALAALKGDAK